MNFPYPRNFGGTTLLMLSWRQTRTISRQRAGNCLRTMAWWDAIQPKAIICQSMQELILQLCSPSLGMNWRGKWVFPCSALWGEICKEIRKSNRRFARANSWRTPLWIWSLLHWLLKAATSASMKTILSPVQDAFKTASNESTSACSTVLRKST